MPRPRRRQKKDNKGKDKTKKEEEKPEKAKPETLQEKTEKWKHALKKSDEDKGEEEASEGCLYVDIYFFKKKSFSFYRCIVQRIPSTWLAKKSK